MALNDLQASFLAAAQEIHADSLHEKLENPPFQHIAYHRVQRTQTSNKY